MRKFLFLLLIIVALFISSGQTYEQQSLIPQLKQWLPEKPFEAPLSKLEIPYWGKLISIEERGYYPFIEFLLRKSAHFFVFGLLAISVYAVLPKPWNRTLIALIVTLLLAIGDEYHQSLTGGRTPTAQDVLLDFSGALTFIILLRIWVMIRKRRKPLQSG